MTGFFIYLAHESFKIKTILEYRIGNRIIPGYINSMTVMYDEVLFTSKKGVYAYNQNNESLSYMSDFVRGFNDLKFHFPVVIIPW